MFLDLLKLSGVKESWDKLGIFSLTIFVTL